LGTVFWLLEVYITGGAIYPNINTTTATQFLINVYGGQLQINGPTTFLGYSLSNIGNVSCTSIAVGGTAAIYNYGSGLTGFSGATGSCF
jgi:hypothetical protein